MTIQHPLSAGLFAALLLTSWVLSPAQAQKANVTVAPRRLDPEQEVWVDADAQEVIVGGEIVLREGPLELFACLKGTKEHEAIVAVHTKAYLVHTGLLAVGAKDGNPATFTPEYRAAAGSEIDVEIRWTDARGKSRKARAQEWIRNAKTKEPLDSPWVFGGSGFYEDPITKERHYQAESGDLICVSNFPSATLDLPVESSQANDALLFEAHTARIPPIGTQIKMILRPRIDVDESSTSPKR